MEQAGGGSVFQLLGAVAFVSVCQGDDGEEGEDTDDCVSVVGVGMHCDFVAHGLCVSACGEFSDAVMDGWMDEDSC